MKLAPLLILLLAIQLSALGVGVSQDISLSVKNESLESVLSAIEKKSSYRFIYSIEFLQQKSKPVTISYKGDVLTLVDRIFKDQPKIKHVVRENYIILNDREPVSQKIAPEPGADPADSLITIQGQVTNEKNEPVVGATISQKGSLYSVVSDDNGYFVIPDVRIGATLLFSSVNYETKIIRIRGRQSLKVELTPKTAELKTVTISTGYQNINKERMVGSYSKLDSANYHRRAGMDIVSRLDGTVSGVLFDKKGGGASMQVRGISTLGVPGTSLSPLIIVDNFPYPGNINDINPNDVDNVIVLKDAAAASIWGTRAGNGVVVITTKKARYNSPLRVTASSNLTFQGKPDLYYFPQISSAEMVELEKNVFEKGGYDGALADIYNWTPVPIVVDILDKAKRNIITSEEANRQIEKLKNVDVRDEMDKFLYRTGLAQQHHVNLSGGNPIFSYQLSTGYNYSLSNLKGSDQNDQFTFNFINSIKPHKDLDFEIGINLIKATDRNLDISLPNVSPYTSLADSQGKALPISNGIRMAFVDTAGEGKLLDWHYRPLDEMHNSNYLSRSQVARFNFIASYRFFSWLKGSLKYQYIKGTRSTNNENNLQSYYSRNLINSLSQIDGDVVTRIIPKGSILDVSNSMYTSNQIRGQLDISNNWADKHELGILLAAEMSKTNGENSGTRFYGYNDANFTYASNLDYASFNPVYGFPFYSMQIIQGNILGEDPKTNLLSLVGNASYTYNGRYTIYGSARRDGANVFGVSTNNKFKPLWSAGINWNIAQEGFFQVDWLPLFRFRTSYGYTGNVNNQLSGLPTVQYTATPDAYTKLPYAQIGAAPNPELRWEEVKIFNAGIDFGLFKQRISGSVEIFKKISKDIIAPIKLDPTSGVNEFTVNSASLSGHGIDLAINSRNIEGEFQWETGFGLSYAKTIVKKIFNSPVKVTDFTTYSINPSEGRLAYGIASYRYAGLDPSNGDPLGYWNNKISNDYQSILNDSIQNQLFHGSAIPLCFGFLRNTISWKGFSISANITYRLKYYFRKPTVNYSSLIQTWNGHSDYSRRWQNPGDERYTSVPSFIYPLNTERDLFYQLSSINVLRADNVKLQDIRFQYSLEGTNSSSFLKNAQVFVYANNLNLILWRKENSSYDPDFSGGNSIRALPTSRLFTVGFFASF
ncbi:MAG: SusC/RagA family TonB-linked outer membrane protein [Candidatus Pseudobacter hemicellulosilyticus]|uniref:SusC/RagA family TonB-linked outer membrane protein n=1 Tax=Candidatus Pseudobacter hemicellulosilyticus TaxID=3121375 RepID=A0AAJ5WSZ7_9BACT|nr:MAG: SusC/RagA family TonB-linked outer membrane protein [Pseudobacter sp.]